MDIITTNLALTFIIQIDNYFAKVQTNSFLNQIVSDQPLNFGKLDEENGLEREENKRVWWRFVIIPIYKLLSVFYSAVYFYFMPFFIVFWPLLRS